jgi:plastocyanin
MIPTRPRRTRRSRYALAVLAVVAPVLAMLGFAPTAAAAAQPPPPQTVTVPIRNFTFTPADLTVHVGDTVIWVNEDRAPHDATTTGAPVPFGSGILRQGESYRYTFTAPGTYSYQCTIHPNMVGTVTAVEHEAAAPAVAPPLPAQPVPPAPEVPADGAPAAGGPAGEAVAPAPPAPDAPAAPAPAPGAVSPGTQPAPGTSQVAGAAQQGRQLNPLLIVAGFALGLATLCLLMISARPAGAPAAASGGAMVGTGAGSLSRPAGAATMVGSRHRRRGPLSPLPLRVVAAAGLAIDAYVHFDLAADYDLVGSAITQGTLFRVQGVVAALAALVILLIGNTRVYQAVFLVAVSALVPVVLYTYVDVGALGPLPDMYEPVWYADKTISAIGEAVAALAAAGLLALTRRPRNSTPA